MQVTARSATRNNHFQIEVMAGLTQSTFRGSLHTGFGQVSEGYEDKKRLLVLSRLLNMETMVCSHCMTGLVFTSGLAHEVQS